MTFRLVGVIIDAETKHLSQRLPPHVYTLSLSLIVQRVYSSTGALFRQG